MRYLIATILICLFALCDSTAEARGRRGYSGGSSSYGGWQKFPADAKIVVHDGLPLVNALRKARGLHPFKRDEKLWANAAKQAERQARHGFMGHDGCDLSDGAAEGCGCAEVGNPGGWNSCCWTEGYTYASAAYVDVVYPNGSANRFCTIHVK